MAEQFANNATTTLNGGIDDSTTSVTVTDASSFPVTGTFRILIEDEILSVTSVAGNVFTVTRGVESTTATAHSDASDVVHVLTAGALVQLKADAASSGGIATGQGTTASRPAAGNAGDLYLGESYIARDDGTNWIHYGPVFPMAAPTGTFSWKQQDTASVTVAPNGAFYFQVDSDGTNVPESYVKAAPSTPYIITAGLDVQLGWQYGFAGICVRNSTTTETDSIFIFHDDDPEIRVANWATDAGAPSTTSVQFQFMWTSQLLFLRIENDGTNLNFSYSTNGVTFRQVHSQAVGTNTGDEVGFIMSNYGIQQGNPGAQMNVYSWVEA